MWMTFMRDRAGVLARDQIGSASQFDRGEVPHGLHPTILLRRLPGHGGAAVGAEDLAGDPAAGGGAEIKEGVGDELGLAIDLLWIGFGPARVDNGLILGGPAADAEVG